MNIVLYVGMGFAVTGVLVLFWMLCGKQYQINELFDTRDAFARDRFRQLKEAIPLTGRCEVCGKADFLGNLKSLPAWKYYKALGFEHEKDIDLPVSQHMVYKKGKDEMFVPYDGAVHFHLECSELETCDCASGYKLKEQGKGTPSACSDVREAMGALRIALRELITMYSDPIARDKYYKCIDCFGELEKAIKPDRKEE